MGFMDQYFQLLDATLDEWHLFSPGSYGWLDADRHNPDYYGLGYWSQSSPGNSDNFQPDLHGPVVRRPTPHERDVSVNGDDYFGLMESARLTIGQAAILARDVRWVDVPTFDSPKRLFWIAITTAQAKLAAAVERLMMLAEALNFKRANPHGPKFEYFRWLCKEAGRPLSEPSSDYAARADARLDALGRVLRDRNAWIHKVGSLDGRFQSEVMDQLQSESPTEFWSAFSARIHEGQDADSDSVVAQVRELADAYRAAIELGNFVLFLAITHEDARGRPDR